MDFLPQGFPPFPGGNGLLGCGITFDIFTHGKPQVSFLFTLFYNLQTKEKKNIHANDLGDGYNVAAEKINSNFYKSM